MSYTDFPVDPQRFMTIKRFKVFEWISSNSQKEKEEVASLQVLETF